MSVMQGSSDLDFIYLDYVFKVRNWWNHMNPKWSGTECFESVSVSSYKCVTPLYPTYCLGFYENAI